MNFPNYYKAADCATPWETKHLPKKSSSSYAYLLWVPNIYIFEQTRFTLAEILVWNFVGEINWIPDNQIERN